MPDEPVLELYDGTDPGKKRTPTVDTIVIHGLNPSNDPGHSLKTWETEGHLWLSDSLPLRLPQARVFIYEYNSSPVFNTSRDKFWREANTALEGLRAKRVKDPRRRPVMIGHSLGGILIKQMLANAYANCDYRPTKDATTGLMFFGTPYTGFEMSDKIKLGTLCASIAQVGLNPTVSNDIMEALKSGSLLSDLSQEAFRR